MWIVRLALRRPYTFVVLALLIGVLGVVSIVSMTVDIFPAINIPVVTVIWNYSGLSPTEMQGRIVTISERAFTTTVNGIEHIESVSLRGVAVTRLYFHPNVPIEAAIAQVNAQAQQIVRALPPGIFPPQIIQYNAASVPVLLASLSSDQLPEQELNDLGNSFIRTQLVTVQGASIPLPYGGKVRVVNVDIDPDALYSRGLSPQDVSNAILTQNVILPAGTAKIGSREYDIATSSSPEILGDLNNIPVRYVKGVMVYVRDVAFVHDGFNPQTNLVRRDGRHSALLPILSNGSASTLTVVAQARQLMPKILAGLPPSLKVDFLFDQSVFVRAAITGVLHEGAIAGCLTALMILLFLGSWRSTLIVITSIPLSILTSIIMLNALHQSLNVMMVDDATVEIENNHRHMDLGKPLRQAILDGAAEVATPAFVATLSICIVFVPILFLGGVGGALFAPLAMSVVFAMLASYLLSRTLVPTMVLYLLAPEARARHARDGHGSQAGGAPGAGPLIRRSFFGRISESFESRFLRLTSAYEGALDWGLTHARVLIVVFLAFA
ncbi:MAG: efflux RND transporter permease subunit, partial [Chloroflexi bacterium]